ncbi:NAD-binding protein [Zavarzinella formosa]|uniref:NAD-binding protein n=1 Tax=Zavarzinella formosa TaxID=360055 RepID=UPI0002E6D16A|nr:NAD-binding protein [Zavarzinella formosa]
MDGPVILCGLGRLGRRVLECLRATGVPVVVVDSHVRPDDPQLQGIQVILGDCRDRNILTAAGVLTSRGVLLLTSNDLVNFSATLMVRQLAPSVRVVIRLFNQNLLQRLGKTVSNVVPMSVSGMAAPLLALTAATGEVLGTFQVGQEQFQAVELTVAENSPLCGLTISDANQIGHYLLISHAIPGRTATFLRDIPLDHRIGMGEKLTIAGRTADLRKLQPSNGKDEDDVRWAGKLRRFGRICYRTFAELELAVKICSIALFIVVSSSAATYHWGLGLSWADGLYRTVSVIATGAELGAGDYEGWGKVFVSTLRIFGTVLVAAFTAILTNFLIRAKLGGVFEVRRIPDSGHVVVIGLGNVGFRAVEELVRLGERPVVIEMKQDDLLVSRCRRSGVPVIIGDGAAPDILKQARVKEARAVICATDNDLLNLEIALLVSEFNPQQRVVVRLGDTALAETARAAAGVKMALSLPDLAAPAFAAGLLGDRVSTMFQSAGRTMAVVEFNITNADDHQFIGHSLKALAIDYGFLPVEVFDETGAIREYRHANQQVRVGERLLVILPISALDRISRRIQPVRMCSVIVHSFPLSARDAFNAQLRAFRQISPEEADAVLDQPPFEIARGLSLGEAEEMIDLYHREKVDARLA